MNGAMNLIIRDEKTVRTGVAGYPYRVARMSPMLTAQKDGPGEATVHTSAYIICIELNLVLGVSTEVCLFGGYLVIFGLILQCEL
jgi:hypothetical protein